jgi:hypothetical protein
MYISLSDPFLVRWALIIAYFYVRNISAMFTSGDAFNLIIVNSVIILASLSSVLESFGYSILSLILVSFCCIILT